MQFLKKILLVMCFLNISGLAQADFILLAANEDDSKSEFAQSHDKPRIGNRQAAVRVEKIYPGTRILSVKLIRGDGPAVYKVKMISSDGVVRSVFVDGSNGEVFE